MRTKLAALGITLLMASGGSVAAPLTLEGMGIQKQWIDT